MHELPSTPHETSPSVFIDPSDTMQPIASASEVVPVSDEITAPGGTPEPPADQPSLVEVFENLYVRGRYSSLEHFALLPAGEAETEGQNPPVNENIIVRRFPAAHHKHQTMSYGEAERRVAITLEHHGELRGTPERPGIIIPNTYYQAVDVPNGPARIMNITERVDGEPIDTLQLHMHGLSASEKKAITQLADSLIGYHEWVLDTQQPMFLADLTALGQYRISPDGRPVLIDTDPFMGILSTKEGWEYFGLSLDLLTGILHVLPDDDHRDDLKARLYRMSVTYRELTAAQETPLPHYDEVFANPYHR